MKLRTRTPGRPGRAAADDDGEVLAELPVARVARGAGGARRSLAPRTPRAPPADRPRPRTAPRGGVQKRKVARPTARPRPAGRQRGAEESETTPAAPRARPPRAASAPRPRAGRRAAAAKIQDDEEDPKKLQNGVDTLDAGKEEKPATTIDDLPEEVMVGTFSYFRPPQLCWKIGRVCRRWATWSVSSILWKDKDYILSPDPNLSSRRRNN